MSSGKGWLMRSTFLPKARILNMLDVLFFVETPKNIWQEGCSFGRPNLSRWVQSTVLGWTHRMYHGVPSLRSKEIRSTAWSRKCCWRTDLFEIWISCIWPLVSLQGKSWGDVCNVGFVREKNMFLFTMAICAICKCSALAGTILNGNYWMRWTSSSWWFTKASFRWPTWRPVLFECFEHSYKINKSKLFVHIYISLSDIYLCF